MSRRFPDLPRPCYETDGLVSWPRAGQGFVEYKRDTQSWTTIPTFTNNSHERQITKQKAWEIIKVDARVPVVLPPLDVVYPRNLFGDSEGPEDLDVGYTEMHEVYPALEKVELQGREAIAAGVEATLNYFSTPMIEEFSPEGEMYWHYAYAGRVPTRDWHARIDRMIAQFRMRGQ